MWPSSSWPGSPRTEGVLFVGRAQEKALVWRTQRRYNDAGEPYASLVRSTAFVNYFYFYCVTRISARSSSVLHLLSLHRQAVPQRQRVGQNQAAKAGIGFEALTSGSPP